MYDFYQGVCITDYSLEVYQGSIPGQNREQSKQGEFKTGGKKSGYLYSDATLNSGNT